MSNLFALLSKTFKVSERLPGFGQLVVNISYLARGWTKSAAWDVEDEDFLTAATSHLESLKRLEPSQLTAQGNFAHVQEKQREKALAAA